VRSPQVSKSWNRLKSTVGYGPYGPGNPNGPFQSATQHCIVVSGPTMQSGLFGVLELQGRGLPNYLDRSLSPVASRATSRAYRGTRPAALKELGCVCSVDFRARDLALASPTLPRRRLTYTSVLAVRRLLAAWWSP